MGALRGAFGVAVGRRGDLLWKPPALHPTLGDLVVRGCVHVYADARQPVRIFPASHPLRRLRPRHSLA